MSDIAVQSSFNSGELSPSLYGRVDVSKYRSGAAKLKNFFVDYRGGGASTRPGTAYVNQVFKSSKPVRLIRFQASFNVGYILEFGDFYVRFYFNGKAVLETGFLVSGATNANPCVITVGGNNYKAGDWIFISGVSGMTQLNGLFFQVLAVSGSSVTLGDLNGNNINSTGFGTFSGAGTAQRQYTITSPFAAADLALLKFSSSTTSMILTHPNYQPQQLTLFSPTNWTISTIAIGSTAAVPTGLSASTTQATGSTHFSYGVTSIDVNGQESNMSAPVDLVSNIRAVAGSNSISWSAAPGAVAYNVYEAELSYFGILPGNVQYGFIGTSRGTTFIDTNIAPNFSLAPPIAQSPFSGAGVDHVTVTSPGSYTVFPTMSFVGGSTVSASATPILSVITAVLNSGGTGYNVGETVFFQEGVSVSVTSIGAGGAVPSFTVLNGGGATQPPLPVNPVSQTGQIGGSGTGFTINFTWGVFNSNLTSRGQGYPTPPSVSFSPAGATAVAVLQDPTLTNPSVCGFFQQRLVLAAPTSQPQTFWCSKPGAYFNFDTTLPSAASDSINGTLVSAELNTIKSLISSAAGMLALTDKASWLINGGFNASAISPGATVAHPQSFIGANDVPPIVANYDVLYIQSKGAGVRDLVFNFYFSVFTSSDISVLSSHFFYGFQILEWAWAETPFYVAWAVRNDGAVLSLTYLKEQEYLAWAQHTTAPGLFKSVASVTESTPTIPEVDAVYFVVQRVVNGVTVQYIERMAERIFPNVDAMGWCVDAGISYSGPAATTFTGAKHLAGLTVTGVANGVVIPPFVMPVNGTFTLSAPATDVIIGLAFTADLQTLPIDVGDPSVQGKVKKIPFVDIKVNQTLGLSIGPDFDHLQPMKDLVVGNVSSMLTGQEYQVVSGLQSNDVRTFLGSAYTVPGQYAIRQSQPLPATVMGVFPSLVQGDDR